MMLAILLISSGMVCIGLYMEAKGKKKRRMFGIIMAIIGLIGIVIPTYKVEIEGPYEWEEKVKAVFINYVVKDADTYIYQEKWPDLDPLPEVIRTNKNEVIFHLESWGDSEVWIYRKKRGWIEDQYTYVFYLTD